MLPHTRHNKRRDWMTDIICLSVTLFVFYMLWLGSHPLFTPDEGRYSEVAREMVASGDYITPRVNGVAFLDKPALYYWLQATAIHLFGVNEWALRLFPALLGIFGCIMTYVCGRQLYNRRTGLISAIILATAPLYFGSAHYADLNLEVAVFLSCALLCFITGIQRDDKSRRYFLLGAYLFAAMAFLTKGLIGIAFPAMIIGAWIILLWRWDLLKRMYLLPGLVLFLAIITPWYVLVQKANPQFLHFFFVTQQVTRFLSSAKFNNPTPFWFYLPIVLFGLFPWTIFVFQALSKTIRQVWLKRHEYQTELFLLLWLGIVFTFFSIPHSKTIGYILPIFPVLALIIGNYLSCAWENARQASIYFGIINYLIMGSIFGAFILALPELNLIEFSAKLVPHLRAIALVYIISGLISLLWLRRSSLLPLFSTCVISSVIFLLMLAMNATHLNQNTTKPLVQELKHLIKPQDEVIMYFKYYHDVPLYLGQRVTVVADWQAPDIIYKDNWVRELWFGMAFQKTDAWLINETTFWQRWNSDKRVFVFMNPNQFKRFKKHAQSYFVLGKANDIMMISNKPSYLSLLHSLDYFLV